MDKPSVYDYLDYRAYLRDMFTYRKKKHRSFSHRYFANKAQFASPNFVQLVMKGKRNLTNKSAAQVATGFGLGRREREYFEALVFMNQAVSHEDRDYYYQKMTSMRGARAAQKLDKARYEYFSKWYYPVIREVATWNGGNLPAVTIAKMLDPPIKPREAEKALKLLQELQLLERDADGCWVQPAQTVTTGPEVRSLEIANFHREMIRRAVESIDRQPPEERDVSAVTVGVNRDRMKEIKQRIAAFRKEILELACEDGEPAQVIQINIQAFPLTKRRSG